MGKYAEAIGVWDHQIGDIKHSLVPKANDNNRVAQVVTAYNKSKDMGKLMEGMGNIYYDMVLRSDTSLSEEDKTELKEWISINQKDIMSDLMVALKWQTKEDQAKFEEMGEEMLKKQMNASG